MGLVSELRRRNVLRMAALYVVAAWLIMQVAGVLIDLGALPEWSGPWVLAVLAIGFPIALIFSWFYEITPEGLALEEDIAPGDVVARAGSRRMDFVIIAILAAAVILFAYDKWWPEGPMEQSIAVLAFENMSGDESQEYFSDGISEEILNLLAQLPELTVISRSSAFSFKGKDVAIPEIAEQLNVAHILEGSVRRVGDRVRITAQLIEARSDAHLWSQTYDRELDDILAVQDEIAAAISDALKVKLAIVAGENVLPTTIKTANREAYDAYLRGRELTHDRVKSNLKEAIRLFERSISLDNRFAPAHAQLAIATLLYYGWGHEEARRTADRHLNRAQELEPELAEAHGGRAAYELNNDGEAAIAHARKALAVNPNYIDAMHWLVFALGGLGRYEEADAIRERMLVTDPLSIVARMEYVTSMTDRGHYAEAHAIADGIVERSPTAGYRSHAQISFLGEGNLTETVYWGLRAWPNKTWAGDALMFVGEFDEARRLSWLEHWVDLNAGRWDEAVHAAYERLERYPNYVFALSDTASILFYTRRFDEALALYERALELSFQDRIVGWGDAYMTHLAFLRRNAGDEEGAEAVARMVRESVAQDPNEHKDWMDYVYAAMIAAFDRDADRAINALTRGVRQHGLRATWVFIDPVYDDLRDDPRFIALKQELDEILAGEHEDILQLMCFNNPAPDEWQPMPATCEGVLEKRAH